MIRNIGSHIVDVLRLDFITSFFHSLGECQRLLDLGCGEKPFKFIYEGKVENYIGMDMPSSPHHQDQVDVFANGEVLPFQSESFDVVLCSELMEHVTEPTLLLTEINRILVPGGRLILTTPFLVPEHETPIDYFRYTRFGLSHLLNKAGFQILELEPFGELFGVFLSFIIQIQMKFWHLTSKKIHLKWLATEYNPFVFLFVLLPQWSYLSLIGLIRKSERGERIYKNLSYTTKGFGVVVCK